MKLPTLTSLLLGKQYIAVEHFTLNQKEKVSIVQLKKNKKELSIEAESCILYSDTCFQQCNKALPFFLVINTKQVIHKEVEGIAALDQKLLHKGFPNTNWEEFYFEIWRLKTKSVIAISRKTYVEELLSNYRKQGISVVGLSLGACSSAEIYKYTEEQELHTNHQIISIDEEGQIIRQNLSSSERKHMINGLAVQNSELLPFSGVVRLLIKHTTNTGNLIEVSEQLYKDSCQQRFFSKMIKIGMGVLLFILLLNFFVCTHYFKRAEETSQRLQLNKSSLENIQELKQSIQTKEQKLNNVLAVVSSQSSYFINEVTKIIPKSILLTELVYAPLDEKVKPEKTILFRENTIKISGTTTSNAAFTKWIENIEKLEWLEEVVILQFGKKDRSKSIFSIKLILK